MTGNHTRSFFEKLYQNCSSSTKTVEIRRLPNEYGKGYPSIDSGKSATEIAEIIEAFDNKTKPFGVFFGVALRRKSFVDEDVNFVPVEVPALWADVDAVNLGYDMAQTLLAIRMAPGLLQPTAIVNSGNLLHQH